MLGIKVIAAVVFLISISCNAKGTTMGVPVSIEKEEPKDIHEKTKEEKSTKQPES